MFKNGKLNPVEVCPGLSMRDHAQSIAMFALRDYNYSQSDLEYATYYYFKLFTQEFENIEDMANFVEDLDITLHSDLLKGLLDVKNGRLVQL